MFTSFLTWLRSIFCGQEPTPIATRLDEFHKATFAELFNEAWLIVTGIPPRSVDSVKVIDGKFKLQDPIQKEFSSRGARIEFNKEGLGRVVSTDYMSQIDIDMDNLPVKVRWNPTKMCLRPTEAQSRKFAVHLFEGDKPASEGSMEPSSVVS